MKVLFYGGRQAGMVVLLSLLGLEIDVFSVIPEDDIVSQVASNFDLKTDPVNKINDKSFVDSLKKENIDLIICCHGRKILDNSMLSIGAINLHPCLYKYKGKDPIKRLLNDKETKASVGCHWMVEEVDQGGVITEKFIEVSGDTEVEIYNQLYPLYSEVLVESMNKIKNNK
ncbi:MAG: formyltransferase family protein [Candidatus Magasanikbacteria bacterium]